MLHLYIVIGCNERQSAKLHWPHSLVEAHAQGLESIDTHPMHTMQPDHEVLAKYCAGPVDANLIGN